jgi:formylglycine-generating enzyme required for sulfatase activity
VVVAAAGCSDVVDARPQWLVAIGTDAPVPQLGDRLLIEVLDEVGEACTGCRRQLGAPGPEGWPVSFGIAEVGSGPRRLRVRLYRASNTAPDGLPAPPLLIDALATLPPAAGITEVELTLSMACFGLPVVFDDGQGGAESCDPATGALAPMRPLELGDGSRLPRPGSWPPARVVGCAGPTPEGMVCIPGGVFLLGSHQHLPISPEIDPDPEQLVQLSPFWLERDEMTVGDIRPLVADGLQPPIMHGTEPGNELCAYTASGDEGPSVNCLSHAQAEEACARRDRRLPTEAEWEYAAGNVTAETIYPWESTAAPPTELVCATTLVGRGRGVLEGESTACVAADTIPGPIAGGFDSDVTTLGLRNMGGNVSEWVADSQAPYTDPACWAAGARLLVNPVCLAASSFWSHRGGSWADPPFQARAASRQGANGAGPQVGVRCALSATPSE